jgi:hypothetical protein
MSQVQSAEQSLSHIEIKFYAPRNISLVDIQLLQDWRNIGPKITIK